MNPSKTSKKIQKNSQLSKLHYTNLQPAKTLHFQFIFTTVIDRIKNQERIIGLGEVESKG